MPKHPWKRTRFAPSPTGYLHRGHLLHAIWVWGMAQKHQLKVHLRIEDHDQSRYRAEHEKAILEDLEWLGLEWDSFSAQRNRQERYKEITEQWLQSGQAYYCDCSRKDIQKRQAETENQICRAENQLCRVESQLNTSQNTMRTTKAVNSDETPYDQHCRNRNWNTVAAAERTGQIESQQSDQQLRLRLQLPSKEIYCPDLLQQAETQNPTHQCGDLLLRDNRGQWTYNYCVTVDDLEDNIDLIIRGIDLRHATGRQIQLRDMLTSVEGLKRNVEIANSEGAKTEIHSTGAGIRATKSIPDFLHHPLLLDAHGRKLAKRDKDQSITEIRQSGTKPEELFGQVALAAGLIGEYRELAVAELGSVLSGSFSDI